MRMEAAHTPCAKQTISDGLDFCVINVAELFEDRTLLLSIESITSITLLVHCAQQYLVLRTVITSMMEMSIVITITPPSSRRGAVGVKRLF